MKLAIGEYYAKDTWLELLEIAKMVKWRLNFGIWKFPENAANPQYLNPEEWIK